jgi:hypothetical protein
MINAVNNRVIVTQPKPKHPAICVEGSQIVVDGHKWMAMLRFPHFTVAALRDMRVGDELSMFEFLGPAMGGSGEPAVALATISRARGKYQLEVAWMLHVGKVARRGHIWYWVNFALEKNSVIRFIPPVKAVCKNVGPVAETLLAERACRHVCRLAYRLSQMAEKAGDRNAMVDMLAAPRRAGRRAPPQIAFLDTLAAAPVRA